LRKAAFAGCRSERNAVEQDLAAGRSKQKPVFILFQGGAQLPPGNIKLRRRSRMAELIEPCELQQDVEAADKGACRAGFGVYDHRPQRRF
jgi:hypothetical protein